MSDQASASSGREEPADGADNGDVEQPPISRDELFRRLGQWSAQVREHLATLGELSNRAPDRRSSRRARPPQQ